MSNENQHWVPKFLLRNFADGDGRVFCLDVQSDAVSKLPPKRAASSIGHNEFTIGGRPISFEHALEKVETRTAPVLKQVAQLRSVAGLTNKQRSAVARFVATQSFRTEAFFKGLKQPTDRDRLGAILAELWRSASLVASEIASRRWAVMSIDGDDVFYLGDHPVVLQHSENPSTGGEVGFDVKGVEGFLPLSPKCALYMPCNSISEQIVLGYENAVSIHRQFRSDVLRGKPSFVGDSTLLHAHLRKVLP